MNNLPVLQILGGLQILCTAAAFVLLVVSCLLPEDDNNP